MTCLNHVSLCLLTVARRGSCGGGKEVDLTELLVVGLVVQVRDAKKFPQALSFESLNPF